MKKLIYFLLLLLLVHFNSCKNEESISPILAQDKFDFVITATLADDNLQKPFDYTVEVIAKDVALGTVKWTENFAMNGAGVVHVPTGFGHYTFKAMRPGYLPHVQHFLVTEISENQNLLFEFLPETLEGFIEQELGNGALKIYLPNDQNRCKLYFRADVAEGFSIQNAYVDHRAIDRAGLSVADLNFAECRPGNLSVSACGKNVNLFGNTPFAMAQDYCAGVDLTLSVNAYSLDDVNLESLIYFEFHKPGNTGPTPEYDAGYHTWKGSNNN
jgi:hypothetical protein